MMHKISAKINANKLIAVLLTTIMVTQIIIGIPLVLAKTYTAMPDRNTGIRVGISPTLIGIDQSVLINVFVYPGTFWSNL